jgi:hypothetical protein
VIRRLFSEERRASTAALRLGRGASLPRPVQRPHPPIHVGGAGEKRTLPIVARHADVWNCPTYALVDLPRKLDVLAAECRRIGRDPATLRVTEEAVLALVAERGRSPKPARSPSALRRPGMGLRARRLLRHADDVVARIRERAALGVRGFVFSPHEPRQRRRRSGFSRRMSRPAVRGAASSARRFRPPRRARTSPRSGRAMHGRRPAADVQTADRANAGTGEARASAPLARASAERQSSGSVPPPHPPPSAGRARARGDAGNANRPLTRDRAASPVP